MTVSLSMLGGAGWQFFDNNGDPLSGGLLYTYDAGTTTPRATYTSSSGGTANANPIVLDSAGRTPQEVWLTNGVLYKFVLKTSADVLIGTYDNISGQGFYEDLAAALAASSGSSLVGFIGAGSGAVAQTVQSKLRQIVHVDDYNGDIAAAVAALPAEGGEVHFAAKTYRSPYYGGTVMSRNNISFRGAGKPRFNSGYTALEGGTIIIGPFVWGANGCIFSDLGIDSGSAACTTYFSGVGQEGLVTGGLQNNNYYKGNTIRNVSVICQGSSSANHAILFESQTEGTVENISTVYAAAGFVIKGNRINVDGVYARSHRNYAVLAKSDQWGTCDSINYNNIIVDTVGDPAGMIPGNGANWDTNGFVLLPVKSGANEWPVTNITASNLVLKNCVNAFEFDTTAGAFTDAIRGVTITNATTHNHYFAGISVEEYSREVRFANTITTTSDYGVVNAGDDVIFDTVTSNGSGHNCFQSGGNRVVFENCTADNPYSINYFAFVNTGGSSIVRTPNYGPGITVNKTQNVAGTQTIEDIAVLNTQTSNTLSYLRRQLVTQIEAITGAGSVVAAWFGTDNPNATTMTDYSPSGGYTATFRNGTTLAAKQIGGAGVLGMGNTNSFDANTVWDTPDAAAFSFGNGATDSPFSVMTVCKPVVSYIGEVAAKYDATVGSPQREWYFQLTSSSGLYFVMTDNSTGGTIGRRYSGSLSPYDNVWTTFTGTYSGSAAASGIKVYINNSDVTNSDISVGSYTAMSNTTAKVGTYAKDAAGTVTYPLYAVSAVTMIFNVQLSAGNIAAVRALLNNYFNL